MNPKNVLTAIGVISIIEGLGFYFMGGSITKQAFGELSGNGLEVGILMHQVVGAIVVGFGLVIFTARNLDADGSKKILNAVGLANVIILASALVHFFGSVAKPPIPVMVLMAVIAAVSFYTANKKEA